MATNTDRIDDCVVALLLLGRHDGQRFGSHSTGLRLISIPVRRAKSVVLTDVGLDKAERLFRELFEMTP
jgi:hypothetical protein